MCVSIITDDAKIMCKSKVSLCSLLLTISCQDKILFLIASDSKLQYNRTSNEQNFFRIKKMMPQVNNDDNVVRK